MDDVEVDVEAGLDDLLMQRPRCSKFSA